MFDLTIEEIKEKIVSQWDAIDFCDYLEVGIKDLVQAFSYLIEDNYESVLQALEE
jgi:hypothetical protein